MTTDNNLPPLPEHPEPRTMTWSRLEREAITAYARAAIAADRAQRVAPVARPSTKSFGVDDLRLPLPALPEPFVESTDTEYALHRAPETLAFGAACYRLGLASAPTQRVEPGATWAHYNLDGTITRTTRARPPASAPARTAGDAAQGGGVAAGRLYLPCCDNERRNRRGGCENCGDPCL